MVRSASGRMEAKMGITGGNMFPKVVQVIPVKDNSVYVYFKDGKIVCYDTPNYNQIPPENSFCLWGIVLFAVF